MTAPELDAGDRDALRARLAELRQAVSEQTERLRPLCARSDAVGIERVEWTVLIEMAARAEMLRRLNTQVAEGCALLGLDPQGVH